MTTTDHQFVKQLKTTLWSVTGLLLFGMITMGVSFYYKTGKDVEYLQKEQQRLDQAKVNKEAFEITMKNIERQLEIINKR